MSDFVNIRIHSADVNFIKDENGRIFDIYTAVDISFDFRGEPEVIYAALIQVANEIRPMIQAGIEAKNILNEHPGNT